MLNIQQVIASRKAQRQQQSEQTQLSKIGNLFDYLTALGAAKLSEVRIAKSGRPYVAFYDAASTNLDIIMFSKALQKLHMVKPFKKIDLVEYPVYAGKATNQQGVEFIWTCIGTEGVPPNDLTDIADIVKEVQALKAAASKLGATV